MQLRRFFPYIIGLMGILFSLSACNSNPKIKVSADIENALYDKYKDRDISSLEWRLVDGFFVGEFRMDGYHCKAWFDAEGEWHMTETTDIIYKDLPKDVRVTFESGDNGKARESYKVEFSSVETRYIIETKKSFFFYRSNGEQFKKVDGFWANRPIVIDGEILRFIVKNCDPVTSIIDADMHSTPIRVNIHEGEGHDDRYKIIYFDTPVMWLATVWKIQVSEVPAGVLKAVKELISESNWDSVYRVEHQVVRSAYGFKLKNGESFFFNDDGEQVDEIKGVTL